MKKSVTQSVIWATLAGISYVLCFPNYDLPLCSFLVLPLLLLSQTYEGAKKGILLGFLLSAMVGLGGFHWIVYLGQNFGGMPWIVAVLLLALFCLVAAPQFLAFMVLAPLAKKKIQLLPIFLRPLSWALLYTGLEFLARNLKIFPEHLGNTLIAFPGISQAASLGGVSLLTFLPLWVGASALSALQEKKKGIPSLVVSAALCLALHFWGWEEIHRIEALPRETLRVGIVQHNMEEAEKATLSGLSATAVNSILGKLISLSKDLAEKKADLLVWPETAYPFTFPTGQTPSYLAPGYANLVKQAVAGMGVPLIFGGYERVNDTEFNSAIYLNELGNVSGTYQKNVLLVFGEYFPLGEYFPWLKSLNPLMGDFGRGKGPFPLPVTIKGKPLLMGISICYEAILPSYVRNLAKNGARVFLNVTKDSWYGDSFEPWQHFQLAALRAIENRVPLIRSTNTGLSGLVSATGEIHLLSPPFKEAKEVVEVHYPVNPPFSLYTWAGEWFAYGALFYWIILLFLFRAKGRNPI